MDEVLAVGDAEFQKKCLHKMEDISHAGRTVLFVSHSMHAVTRLCSRCVLLNQGRIEMDGTPAKVANAYLSHGATITASREWPESATAPGDGVTRLRAVRVRSDKGELVDVIDIRKPVGIELEYEILKPDLKFLPHFAVSDQNDSLVFVAVDLDPEWRGRPRPPGRYVSTGWIPGNLLNEGPVHVGAMIATLEPDANHVFVEEAVSFHVMDDLGATNTARGDYKTSIDGMVRPQLEWKTTRVGDLGSGLQG